jgi:hypothetical protein
MTSVEEFLDKYEQGVTFSTRAEMKRDLEEMLQDVGQKAFQFGYERGKKPLGNTVSWERFLESPRAKEDRRCEP